MTYSDLLNKLNKLTPEQLQQPVTLWFEEEAEIHPYAGIAIDSLKTVEEAEIMKYAVDDGIESYMMLFPEQLLLFVDQTET